MWTPKTRDTVESSPIKYFGNINPAGNSILVYGDKVEVAGEKAREHQSRRTANKDTFVKMVRGECGLGTPGVDSLVPLGDGRKVVDFECLVDDEYPHRDEFVSACQTVHDELEAEGDEIPDFILEAITSEVEAD